MKMPIEQRFWRKVDRSGGEDACWTWMGGCDTDGYGRFHYGTQQPAHRISWKLTRGAIPAGLFILHSCDNPPCCNPRHLFAGTHTDNMRDCAAKGRSTRHNALKTHCPFGHEYTPANTYVYQGGRSCRACNLRRTHEKRARPTYTGRGKRSAA